MTQPPSTKQPTGPHQSGHLREVMREAGIGKGAIEAAWPSWWSEEAESSPSARAELRFALSRNLGLSPKALLGERVEFVWRDRTRFKSLTRQTETELAALNSFGTSVGRLVLQAYPGNEGGVVGPAVELRQALLGGRSRGQGGTPVVGLTNILAACWSLGVPVVGLRVFPLDTKSMHAMVVEWSGRHCVLLAREASYPAPIAFTLAHEIGHIGLGHLAGQSALVDLEEPGASAATDGDEAAADAYALTLLTGSARPDIRVNRQDFAGRQLAEAVVREGPPRGIEPGSLALCAGYATGNWAAAMSALAYIYPQAGSVLGQVNVIAERSLDWDALDDVGRDFLGAVMGVSPGVRIMLDNDIALKACRYGIVADLLVLTARGEQAGLLGSARFVLASRLTRQGGAADPAQARAALLGLLAATATVEPDEDELMLAAEMQEQAQRANLPLDGGESQLAAMALRRAGSALLTGDKRAVAALEAILGKLGVLAQAKGVAGCLEQAMVSLIQVHGVATLRPKVCADPDADKAMAICFRCHSTTCSDDEVAAGLASYIADLRTRAPTLLAAGEDVSGLVT